MSNSPKISFIAPCYNGEAYVQRFLTSILNQTYDNVEVIIINDGSKDNTEQIIKSNISEFEKKGYSLILLNQENQGIGASVNNALKYVTGDYLTWFGSDDFAAPEYSRKLVGFLEAHPEFAVVRNDGFVVSEDDTSKIIGKMADGNFDKHNPYLFENAIMERNFQFGYSVIRMKDFDAVNPEREIFPSRHGQNWQLLLPVFYKYKAAFYEEPLYYVIYDNNSVSRQPHKDYEKLKEQNNAYEEILNQTLKSMEIPELDKYLKMVKVKYIRRRMCAAIDFGLYTDAVKEYKSLRDLRVVTSTDKKRYLRAKLPIIDIVIKKIKGK